MKCKICGKRFKLIKENRYLAEEKIGALECLKKASKTFEAFDCPYCGCQNIVNIREGEVIESEAEWRAGTNEE